MHHKKIHGAADWRGRQLFEQSTWPLVLTSTEIDELAAAYAQSEHLPLDALDRQSFPLPVLQHKLAALQTELEEGCGAVLIKGYDVDRFTAKQSLRIFFGLASYIGTAVSQSASGERMFHVRDEGYAVGQPKARGPNTSKRLSFHTDRCDVIGFLCLQQADAGGENQLVSSVAVYNQIFEQRPDLLEQLMQPFYSKRHNVDTANTSAYCQQPVFSFCDGKFASAFLRILIDRAYEDPQIPDMTPLQREALDFVEQVCDRPEMHVEFRQERGDILLINNWITYHRRNAFQDHADRVKRRHLLRVWLATPNSRPLDPAFEANYGATEAGALRGGMNPVRQ